MRTSQTLNPPNADPAKRKQSTVQPVQTQPVAIVCYQTPPICCHDLIALDIPKANISGVNQQIRDGAHKTAFAGAGWSGKRGYARRDFQMIDINRRNLEVSYCKEWALIDRITPILK